MLKKNYDISSRGEITSKKSSSFLRGPRVPIMLAAFPLWTVIDLEISWFFLEFFFLPLWWTSGPQRTKSFNCNWYRHKSFWVVSPLRVGLQYILHNMKSWRNYQSYGSPGLRHSIFLEEKITASKRRAWKKFSKSLLKIRYF